MRVDPASFALLDHFGTLRNEIERRHSQHEAETRQRLGRTNQGRFRLKPIGFIVQKVLLDIKSQPIFLKGFARGGFIAQDIPHVLAVPRSRYGQMHWPIALFGDADPVPETCLPPGHSEALDLAATTPWASEPKAALDGPALAKVNFLAK
jgi:hypothetical protein